MARLFYALLLIVMIIAMPLPVAAQAPQPPSTAPAGSPGLNSVVWFDGPAVYSTIANCASINQGLPYQETGAAATVGYQSDPFAGLPAPNTTYYVHVLVTGWGDACGGMRTLPEIALPATTSVAVDVIHPVVCLLDGVQISLSSDCPQNLPPSTAHPGAYTVPSPDTAHANSWSIPQGHTLEFQIPVRTASPLNNSQLTGYVWMLDGNSNPWLSPAHGVFVFGNQPAVLYPTPSTYLITANSAYSYAFVYLVGSGGTLYFDIGTSPSYGFSMIVNIPAGTVVQVLTDWQGYSFQPNTLYHWRARFVPTIGGSPVFGPDQTFRTLPDGRVIIGQGQATACTEAAFNTALATAKEILFDCGILPVTITLTASHAIASNLTINGGNKVTLEASGANVNHFNVQTGVHLTLTKITLSNGRKTSDCGGSIKVNTGAQLSLNETRFIGNQANAQGGAICNLGTADVTATFFSNNASLGSHGGAIENASATLTVTNNKFSHNTAVGNGGAIDMGGTATVTNTTFDHNSGLRGGAINTYVGNLTIVGSSFAANSASMYGGGLANDASNTTVTGSTFSGNDTTGPGGGIETSGAGSLTLTNTTVSANHAATDGGGLYWYPGGSDPVTILNTTIANNSAETQGGNIYVGGVGVYNASIRVKNTMLVSGTPNNCSGGVLSDGNNLESANSCSLAAAGDKVNLDPKLSALQNNGGLTLTHALLPGSPAVDTGTNSGCPAADQRGVSRPIDGNHDGSAVCDIGAVESPPYWLSFIPAVLK